MGGMDMTPDPDAPVTRAEEPAPGTADGSPPLTVDPEPVQRVGGRLSRRARAWIGMGAVVVALALLTMLSGPGYDPTAPPPAADGGTGDAADFKVRADVGQDAPLQFTMKDVNGVDVKLASFTGKVILINFWATWCGPCRVEIPDLMELQNAYRDDLVVLGVDVLDEFDRVKPFAAEMKVNYPLLDGNNRKDVEEAFGPMWGLPTTVIIARDGKVHKRHSGIGTKEQFEHEIKILL